MMSKKLLAQYGLKWNPFGPELPVEALRPCDYTASFLWRIEHTLVREGGFALITGEPGTGKSVLLRLLAEQLGQLPDITVGVLTHPQSNLADFYRELGDIFAVALTPHNRWNGFKVLRERWQAHLEHSLLRPVLIIDEAQDLTPVVLCELRTLASTAFDSKLLLSIVLAGDRRLSEKLRREDLIPLGSRIRTRIAMEPVSREVLIQTLEHLLKTAGNPKLMTQQLIATLSEHAAGNFRILNIMAGELLDAATRQELAQLDEKLFFQVFEPPSARTSPSTTRSARTR
jgi:type II secretory pathway predicted ATPase ExeA